MTERTQYLIDQMAALKVPLTPEGAQKALEYLDLLLKTGQELNLTSILDPAEALPKHLIDALAALSLLTLCKVSTTGPNLWMDLGSGGGVPGIPLAAVRPDIKMVLVESTRKKSVFLQNAVTELGLGDRVSVENQRSETLAHGPRRRTCQAVFVRAVGPIRVLLELGGAFLVDGGLLVLYKGPQAEIELKAAATALRTIRLKLVEQSTYTLPGAAGQRSLLVFEKIGDPVPKVYPRLPPGTPDKKPL